MFLNNKIVRILFVAALFGVLVIFRAYVIDYIVAPISLLFWLVWRTLMSVHQEIYWLILLAVIAFAGMKINSGWKRKAINEKYRYAYRPPSRLTYWQSLVKTGLASRAGSEQIRNGLRDLAVDILIQDEKDKQDGLRTRDKEEIALLPPSLLGYLFPNGDENDEEAGYQYQQTWQERLLNRRKREKMLIRATLEWMENELEIQHGKINE